MANLICRLCQISLWSMRSKGLEVYGLWGLWSFWQVCKIIEKVENCITRSQFLDKLVLKLEIPTQNGSLCKWKWLIVQINECSCNVFKSNCLVQSVSHFFSAIFSFIISWRFLSFWLKSNLYFAYSCLRVSAFSIFSNRFRRY